MDQATPTRLGDDDRFDLRVAATSPERRNRPMARIVLSGVVFVVAGFVWIGAQAGLGGARGELRNAQNTTVAMAEMLNRLESLESTESQINIGPDERATLKIQQAFQQAGLRIDLPSTPAPTGSGQWRYRSYIVNKVEAPDIAKLVSALENALRQVDGLAIDLLELIAKENTGWEMKVTFIRPEVAS